MASETKQGFLGGLNLDDSPYALPKDAYIDALNITRDATAASSDVAISNIVGNVLVSYPAEGRHKCIGAIANTVRNTIIYFVWAQSGQHKILEYNTQTDFINNVLINIVDTDGVDILGFTENGIITSINIYNREEGDLLFFIDSIGRPTTLDITRFKNQEYVEVTRDIIDVCKNPPLAPPPCLYQNDGLRRTNNLRNKFFRFKYRWVYDSNEKSVCSPISAVPIPESVLSDAYNAVVTNNNVIYLTMNSGAKDVKAIELLVSYVNKNNDWSDFALVESIDKETDILLRATAKLVSVSMDETTGIYFSGAIIAGIVVNIKLAEKATGDLVTVATYTTLDGDSLSDVITALIASAATIGIATGLSIGNDSMQISYLLATYRFYKVDIAFPAGESPDDIDFQFRFYNDGTYPYIDINESNLLFDMVPDLANAQEMPNGNVLAYGGITEGYNRNLEPNVVVTPLTVAASGGGAIGNLNSVVAIVSDTIFQQFFTIQFMGIPAPGTVVTCRMVVVSTVTVVIAGTCTTVAGDTATTVAYRLSTSLNLLGYVNGTTISGSTILVAGRSVGGGGKTVFYSMEIVAPSVGAAVNSIPTFLFSTQRRLGLVYFDKKGKTNGVLYDTNVSFPAYSENGSAVMMLPYINAKIYHVPPDWAYSFQWLLTKENTQFLYWECIDVNTSDINYIYFNVSNIALNQQKSPTTTAVLNWTFQDGDRLRLIRRMSDGTVFSDQHDAAIEGIVTDPNINGSVQTGTFVKIKSFAPFNTVTYTSKFFIIQFYRPDQQKPSSENQVFYEFGAQYPITNPTLSTRAHGGMVTSQDVTDNIPAEFNFYEGDVYFRLRQIVLSQAGVAQYNCLDRNILDTYISAVNSIDGRPNIIDVNAKRAYYSTLLRFGQAYQGNTNINGLNRFYPNNYDQYDYSFGDIMRLKVRDRFMRVFQKLKVGMVPLYHEILKNSDKDNLVVTDKLLNPINYYNGDVGIGDNPESLASYNFADFFTSNIKGVICRVSQDGVEFLSIKNKINSWATTNVAARGSSYRMYGCFDQRAGNYILALESAPSNSAKTITFDVEVGNFESFLSMQPEMMCCIGTLLVSWLNGQLYRHNNTAYNTFYGTSYVSQIQPVFNKNPLQKKTFVTIEEIASTVWEIPQMNTDLNSYGTTKQQSALVASDFEQLEGTYEAAILGDSNSIGGVVEGDAMQGKYLTPVLRANPATSLVKLDIVTVQYLDSPLTAV